MKASKKDIIMNLLFKKTLPFFTLFVSILFVGTLILSYQKSSCALLAIALLIPYLVPLVLFRVICAIYPMKIGASFFGEDKFSPWISSYRIQQVYLMFPILERLLFIVPGLFNLWLRLWGSKIGKNVNFIPGVEVVDRGHITIGDNVFIGNKCYFSPHVVQVRKGRFFLYYKGITIGDNCFLGAFSTFGPGTEIASGTSLPSGSYYTVNKKTPGCLMPDYE